MFTTENLKKGVFTLAVVMIGLALHQKFVAPMISKKGIAPAPKA